LKISGQLQVKRGPSIPENRTSATRSVFGARTSSIAAALNTSTIGIVICDGLLRCALINHVFVSMRGALVETHPGKTISQVFGADSPQIEPAFHHVWDTGKPLSDVELHASSSENAEALHFAVNLRPIKDASGAMRFIAAIFSDATAKMKLQRRLSELLQESEAGVTNRRSLAQEDFAELPEESAKVLRRAIEMLACSAVVRCHLSEMRIANAFTRAAMFIALEEGSDKTYNAALLRMVSMADPSPDDEPAGGLTPISKLPSPRERQIVQLLAEGKANKEIAAILALSTRTVEIYRARLMKKLDLHSVGELVRYAFRNHLIDA
jgi:DNA-binding CsgD family transcriptional regulator